MKVITETTLETLKCANCGILFAIPSSYMEKRREDHAGFHCPNGHDNFYPYETDAEKWKKQAQQIKSQLDKAEIEKSQLNTRLNGALEQLDKAHKGHCPYCEKVITNQNLKRHIHSKHPDKEK